MASDDVGQDSPLDQPAPTTSPSRPAASAGDVTRILSAIEQGDGQAAEELLPLVYQELRQLAAHKMAQEKPGQTLQPTALVHEAYLRLIRGARSPHWSSRGHFFCAAAEAMRRILIERARRKLQPRCGGGWQRVSLDEVCVGPESPESLLQLNDALARLEAQDLQLARLVKLRFFAGLSMPNVAKALGLPLRTAQRNWTYAKTLLYRDLADDAGPQKSPRRI